MKNACFTLFVFFILITPRLSFSQNKAIVNSYEEGEYVACLHFCKSVAKNNPNDLDAILYQAMVWTRFAQMDPSDENYKSTFENGSAEALKHLANLRRKDRDNVYINTHLEDYHFVRGHLLAEADYHASIDEMEKSMKEYLNIMNQLQDQGVHFYVGCSWIKYNSPEYGLNYLKKGLIEYHNVFKSTGKKPEDGFLETLLETIEKLVEIKGYRYAFNTFYFVDLIYSRKENKNIDACYLRCLKAGMASVGVDDKQLFFVLKEHEKALQAYPKEELLRGLRKVFIKSTLYSFTKKNYSYSEKVPKAKELLIQIEKSFQYILDSLGNESQSLVEINQALLFNIYSLYKKEKYAGSVVKSLLLYDVFCSINNNKTEAAQKFLNYGFDKDDIFMQATAILISRTKEKEMKGLQSKMNKLEERIVDRVKTFGVSYTEFDEQVTWLKDFPEFETVRKVIQDNLLQKSKSLIEANEFSKAGLFLLRAQEYFPDVMEFKKLKRTCVEKDYQLNYVEAHFSTEELAWTGSVEDCEPGTISEIAQKKIVQRYDFIRRLSNFPDGTILDVSKNKYCQAAALCMKAQDALSHRPDESWKCYSKDAARGASNSLGMSDAVSGCIALLIDDSGVNNKATGHRGNALNPRNKSFVYGATDNTVSISSESSKVHSDSVIKRFDTEFISWPPRGPVPASLLFDRWSFKPYINTFRFENVTIEMHLNGKPIELDIEYETNYKIGWVPMGIDKWSKEEKKIKVIIKADVRYGYDGEFEPKTFEYEVLVF